MTETGRIFCLSEKSKRSRGKLRDGERGKDGKRERKTERGRM